MEDGEAEIQFKAVANNLGRSAALISVVGWEWTNSKDEGDVVGFRGDPTPRIVPAAGKVLLKEFSRADKFLWLFLTITRSPLIGELRIRGCYEIFENAAGPHDTWYVMRKLTYFDGKTTVDQHKFADDVEREVPCQYDPDFGDN